MKCINYFFVVCLFFAEVKTIHTIFEIIELNQDDWQLYKDLRLKAVQEFPQAFGTTYEEELKVSEMDWKRRLGLNMLFARKKSSENQSNIVGMIGAVVDNKEKTQHMALLISFYVVPDARNQGIGKMLLSSIIEKLDLMATVKKITLKVTIGQLGALKLYKKFGFYINGVLENEYLINNQYYDQFIMTKDLQNK